MTSRDVIENKIKVTRTFVMSTHPEAFGFRTSQDFIRMAGNLEPPLSCGLLRKGPDGYAKFS